MPAHLIYQWPTDQRLSGSVTITPSSADAAYPVANLYDSNPAKPFKLDATAGNIVFDFGSAVAIQLAAIVHHNLDAALDVRLQGNASNAWGAPSLDQAVTIPPDEADGFPVNPWVDLTGGSHTFRYWRLVFPTNSVPVQIGQLWLGAAKRSLVNNIQWGFAEKVDRRLIEHVTDYGVSTIYDLGAKVKSWSPTVRTTDAGIAAIEQWWDACHGRALPTLVVLDPAVNDARLVRFTEPAREITRQYLQDHVIQFGLREVSRGLVL